MTIKTLGIDLAKNVFHLHGMDERGKTVLQKRLRRDRLLAFMTNLPAMPGRHGGVWWRTLLGTRVHPAGA